MNLLKYNNYYDGFLLVQYIVNYSFVLINYFYYSFIFAKSDELKINITIE